MNDDREAMAPLQTHPVNTVARMRDVALAAGVSMATVSNVLNHPLRVANSTKMRVLDVVRGMHFEPDPNAQALRTNKSSKTAHRIRTTGHDVRPSADADHELTITSSSEETLSPHPPVTPTTTGPRPGVHVSLQIGQEHVSGVVDAVMADGSCIWIWADGGMGRRLIDLSDPAVQVIGQFDGRVPGAGHIPPMQ